MKKEDIFLKKEIHIFEKNNQITNIHFAFVSAPLCLADENGDYCCFVEFDRLFSGEKQIFGVDAAHALDLSIRFLEKLLSAKYNDFEVRDVNEKNYISPNSL